MSTACNRCCVVVAMWAAATVAQRIAVAVTVFAEVTAVAVVVVVSAQSWKTFVVDLLFLLQAEYVARSVAPVVSIVVDVAFQ